MAHFTMAMRFISTIIEDQGSILCEDTAPRVEGYETGKENPIEIYSFQSGTSERLRQYWSPFVIPYKTFP